MSNRQLEVNREAALDRRLAEHLGLTIEEYHQLSPELDTDESSDGGLVYGYVLTFNSSSDPAMLQKVSGLASGQFTLNIATYVVDGPEDDHK